LLGCEFPDDWIGEWQLVGQRDPIVVTRDDFAEKGVCHKQTGNMHIVYSRWVLPPGDQGAML
jgi:hypothetical protein